MIPLILTDDRSAKAELKCLIAAAFGRLHFEVAEEEYKYTPTGSVLPCMSFRFAEELTKFLDRVITIKPANDALE